jgi:hypothetical protein
MPTPTSQPQDKGNTFHITTTCFFCTVVQYMAIHPNRSHCASAMFCESRVEIQCSSLRHRITMLATSLH